MNRETAIRLAGEKMDSGELFADLKRRVAIPSDCQTNQDLTHLDAYADGEMRSTLASMGFAVDRYDNPVADAGPLIVAQRLESDTLPTALVYAHGDVVRGMDDSWLPGLSPWTLTAVGERWYGRGTADNKGQHSILLASLASVIQARGGRLGFNIKILVETGEERGSPGLDTFCAQHASELRADVFLACDGPRLHAAQPTVFFGSRGIVSIRLDVDLRPGAHHSGNWGGLLRNPATTLAAAIQTLVDGHGRIQHPALKPSPIPDAVKLAIADIQLGDSQDEDGASIDAGWGEPGLTPEERVFGWNTLEVLAFQAGDVNKPIGAIPGKAVAHLQLRYVLGTDVDGIAPAVRRHLDAHGFGMVMATVTPGSAATRMDPDEPWARWAVESIAETTGKKVAVLPNLGGTLPNAVFANTLGLPTIWVPHSYPACAQHAPNEHLLVGVAREGLAAMAGLFWDLGDPQRTPARS
ncbi:M20 family metallopeptidase [Hydrogenophaga sp.]|uniref:M20 family metallopeptidase n=1 Tax=Hydrogenophaga sp. TaxID=1904254 RepID=UPI0027286AD3|nr:M20 family metallopeptidase [Hydrogenophaga sp.]MDO9435700.1 M20 family metallopeptidase [Hydrogenophaga sp.]